MVPRMEHTRLRHPRWLRRFAAASAALFSWSMVLSAPAAALAKTIADAPAPHKPALRRLSPQDMKKIVGSQLGTGHHVADSTQSGPARPWEGTGRRRQPWQRQQYDLHSLIPLDGQRRAAGGADPLQ